MCPSHYSELFRRYITLISPSTIWTKVLSLTPFLLPFFHYTSQTRCLQCLCGSLLSRVLTPTRFMIHRRSRRLSAVPLKKKSCSVSVGVYSAWPCWTLRCSVCGGGFQCGVRGPTEAPVRLPGDPTVDTIWAITVLWFYFGACFATWVTAN